MKKLFNYYNKKLTSYRLYLIKKKLNRQIDFPYSYNNLNDALIHLGIAHTGYNTQLDFFQKQYLNEELFNFSTTSEIKKN